MGFQQPSKVPPTNKALFNVYWTPVSFLLDPKLGLYTANSAPLYPNVLLKSIWSVFKPHSSPSQSKTLETGFAQFHNSEFGDCLYGMNWFTLSKMELPNSFQDPGACLTAAAVELKCSLWINYNDCPDITKVSG